MSTTPYDWIQEGLREIERLHLRRQLVDRTGSQTAEITLGGKRLLNFGSNDYLGIAADPRLARAVREALEDEGWGGGASPLITGHSRLHRELENSLAAFEGTDAALLFPTGFAANVGVISALADADSVIFSDAKNHASIIDGCRLSGASTEVFAHQDVEDLAGRLQTHFHAKRKLIVTDGLFSMDGDVAPLPQLVELAEQYGAMLVIDEAHATGVLGSGGRGTCELWGVESPVILRVGTLSKALGSLGGFVVAARPIIDWLIQRSRTLIFSTAAPAAVCAAGLAALDLVQTEPYRRERVLQLAQFARTELRNRGWNVGDSTTQIIPVLLGDPDTTMATSARLRDLGILAPGIRPPSVPPGESLLRISLSCDHTEEMIDRLLSALEQVGRE